MSFAEVRSGFDHFAQQANGALKIADSGANRTQAVAGFEHRWVKAQGLVILGDGLAGPTGPFVSQPEMEMRIGQRRLEPGCLLKLRECLVQLARFSQNDADVIV